MWLGRGAETPYLSLQVRPLARAFADHRDRELTPTRLPPIKPGVADLPLSGAGIAELAAPAFHLKAL